MTNGSGVGVTEVADDIDSICVQAHVIVDEHMNSYDSVQVMRAVTAGKADPHAEHQTLTSDPTPGADQEISGIMCI